MKRTRRNTDNATKMPSAPTISVIVNLLEDLDDEAYDLLTKILTDTERGNDLDIPLTGEKKDEYVVNDE